MPRVIAGFPPSKECLSNLKDGEYVMYVGVEDEVGIHPPLEISEPENTKLKQAKAYCKQDGHAPAEAIDAFSAEKMLMYELLHHTDRTSDILEKTPHDQYYDGDMLEFRLAPCSPEEIVNHRAMLHDAVRSKIRHYALEKYVYKPEPTSAQPTAPFFPHVNISVWDKDGNLMDPKHPKYATGYLRLIEQIVDASKKPANGIGMDLSALHPIPKVGNGRYCDLRSAGTGENARLEIRNTKYMEDFPKAVNALCSAVEKGMNPGHFQSFSMSRHCKLEMARRPHFERADTLMPPDLVKRTSKILQHTLNGGIVDAKNYLHLDREALEQKITACADLFPAARKFKSKYGDVDDYTDGFSHALQSRLETLRIGEDGGLTLPDLKEWRAEYLRELVEEYCTLANSGQRGVIVACLIAPLEKPMTLTFPDWLLNSINSPVDSDFPDRRELFQSAVRPLAYLSDERLSGYLSQISCNGYSQVPVSVANKRELRL